MMGHFGSVAAVEACPGRDRRTALIERRYSETDPFRRSLLKRDHMEKQQNIQDGFLNAARKERTLVTIYLTSGPKLTGRIRSFDKYSVVLETTNQEQLIFKHAISTVVLPRAEPGSALPRAAAVPVEGKQEG